MKPNNDYNHVILCAACSKLLQVRESYSIASAGNCDYCTKFVESGNGTRISKEWFMEKRDALSKGPLDS